MRTATILALAAGSGAFMVAKTEVFTWFRTLILARAKPGRRASGAWKWFYKLITCPFCLSTWMCLIASLIWNVRLVSYWWPLGWLSTSLAMTVVAMAAVLVIRTALGK